MLSSSRCASEVSESDDCINSSTDGTAHTDLLLPVRGINPRERTPFFLEAGRREESEVTRKKWLNTAEQARTYVAKASISASSASSVAAPRPFIGRLYKKKSHGKKARLASRLPPGKRIATLDEIWPQLIGILPDPPD